MYQCSLQFSKQTKKVNLMHEAWIQLRCLLTVASLEKDRGLGRVSTSLTARAQGQREPSSRKSPESSNPTCSFWQQVFKHRSAQLLAVPGFFWSMLWKKNTVWAVKFMFSGILWAAEGDLSCIVTRSGCSCRSFGNMVLC